MTSRVRIPTAISGASIKSKFLAALLFAMVLAISARAEKIEFKGCYATWEKGRLTAGNSLFQRVWIAGDSGLIPYSFALKKPDIEWLAARVGSDMAAGTLEASATTGRRSAVGAEGVRLHVTSKGKNTRQVLIWIFPDAAGILMEPLDGDPRSETLVLAPPDLRVNEISLMDQTDGHGHETPLVSERSWTLSAEVKNFDVRSCVLTAENPGKGAGLAFLKLSPLPHARPDKNAADFNINPSNKTIAVRFNGYPVALLAYHGGRAGYTRAMHSFQRCLREYKPGRDGMFVSNTWGDRSSDSRIKEDFILKEVEAGGALGVDVIQVDDGWQKGRSSNSASANGKGVWNGYWAADPHFWDADPVRFPAGLKKVTDAARARGMGFGLWFGPDSTNDAANWKKDAEHLLEFHRELGINYFKIDSMKTHNAESLKRQRAMFDLMLDCSGERMVFDLDVTAEIRPGYFGLPDIGPLFVENRYTDWHSYWPHRTLRNLWMLAQTVDPVRLRMEVLNNKRNLEKYKDDPLAPALYQADTLFAIAMMASPLGWFESSSLPQDSVVLMRPLVAAWKNERARMHGGLTVPVGAVPDGKTWTGFASYAKDGKGGYALLFRELNEASNYSLDLGELARSAVRSAQILGGRGTVKVSGRMLEVTVPEKLDFLWLKWE